MSTISFHYSWVFIGSGYFAREVLKELYFSEFIPNLVATTVDKPAGRGLRPSPNPVKDFLLDIGLPLYEVSKVNSEDTVKYFKGLNLSFLVVCDFGKILKEPILSVAKYPAINIHPSTLPRYRGPAPIERAIMDGVKETGVTITEITMDIDAGPVLAIKKVSVRENETKGELMKKLAKPVPQMLRKVFDGYLNGTIEKKPQEGEPSYAPKISKEELFIDWCEKSIVIFNKIRALSPVPGARAFFRGKLIKILNSKLCEEGLSFLPGEIRVVGYRLVVGTGDRALEILELQPEGKRVMRAKEFIVGRHLDGEFFHSKEVLR